jgi:hypothetical protein
MTPKKPSRKTPDQDLGDAAWGAASFIPHVGPFIAGAKVAKSLYDSDVIQVNMDAREAEAERSLL